MKNYDVINLVHAGILGITSNDLDSGQAYKVLKFKKAVNKAYEAIGEAEKAVLAEAGIKDGESFEKELIELRKTKENPDKLSKMEKKNQRFVELRKKVFEEDVTLEGTKTLSYEDFHTLQKENKSMENKPLNIFEELLEGILWVAPDEKE